MAQIMLDGLFFGKIIYLFTYLDWKNATVLIFPVFATWGVIISTGEPSGDDEVGEKMAKREMLDGVLKRQISDQTKFTVECLWTNHR